jgi:thiamine pyrophosphokinase
VSQEVVVVVAGGEAPDPEAVLEVPRGARVVAADRGLEYATAVGLDVTIAVGDFDSASPKAVSEAEALGVRIDRHPAEKDATDLELALDTALELHPSRILVLAGVGERLDHLLSACLVLAAPRYADAELDAHVGRARVHVVREERTLEGTPGELLSLLAVGGPADGVRTEGLLYPLAGEKLEPGSSRGVSNAFARESARISVESGTLLAVRPGVENRGAE